MSRSRESQRLNKEAEIEHGTINRGYGSYLDKREGLADEARGRSNQVFDRAYKGYGDWLDAYGPGGSAGTPSIGGSSRSHFENLAKTGGVTDENWRRIRGNGVYDEFAKTGGMSDTQRQDFRQRATRTIPSFYENVRNEMDRTRNVQGGYAPGYDAQTAKLARDQANAGQDAALDAEVNLTNMVNEGRRWGTEGMSRAELGGTDLATRGMIAGAQGLYSSDAANLQAEIANRGLGLEALGGLRGLRTDTPGEVAMYEDLIGQGMRDRMSGINANLGQRMQYNPNRGFGDYLMQGLGIAAPMAATLLTGGAAAPAMMGSGGFGSYAQGQQGGTSGGYANIPTQSGVGYQVAMPQPYRRYTQPLPSTGGGYGTGYGAY